MSNNMQNPEVDLLILESLEEEFKPVSDIAAEANVSTEVAAGILNELLEQGMAIEKQGLSYRLTPEEDQ